MQVSTMFYSIIVFKNKMLKTLKTFLFMSIKYLSIYLLILYFFIISMVDFTFL